ncbi:hypothetical protein M5E86_22345 [Blautia wexlerae]|nr:hypothetical protein M5E86_22345 [Blautia wexlerae]
MDKKRTELIPILLMFSLRICSGIMVSVCSAAGDMLHGICKDCENKSDQL